LIYFSDIVAHWNGTLYFEYFFSIGDPAKAVMRFVNEDDMVGRAITILPGGIIKNVDFPVNESLAVSKPKIT